MADVKIPITASVKGVLDELSMVERKIREVEKAGERLARIKFKPIDAKEVGEELKKLEQMMLETHRRVQGAGGGGMMPAAPGALPTSPIPRPGGGGARRGGRGAYTHAPGLGSIPQQFIGGVGGGFSTVGSFAARGAVSGAYGGGGLAGGAMGLMGGLGIGALAFGAFKVGQGISEGYDMATERAGSIDKLKRQLGDVGVSFEHLKSISEQVAQGLMVNSKEAAELAVQFNRLSRGAGGQAGLVDGTRVGIGLSRAYGLDAGQGVNFVGGMANMDRRQNNRELALLLAESIAKSGMSARADEVMQAMMGYASSISRMVMGTGGLAGYSGAYSSLMGMHGMTSENASGILGAANASMMRMGNSGEAGQNFTMMALSRSGRLNPVQAAALAEGGLFGTRADVFGPGSSISQFMGGVGMPGGGGTSNFSAIRSGLRGLGGDKWLQLDAAKRYFGVGSLSQAAALMNLDEGGAGALQSTLKRAGIDINTVNASGIQALAAAGPNASVGQLRQLAASNQEVTQFTEIQNQTKALDDIKINTGDKLIGPINTMRDALVAIAGKLAPDSAFVRSGAVQKSSTDWMAKIGAFDAETAAIKQPAGATKSSIEIANFTRARMRQNMVAAMSRDLTGVDPALLSQVWANEKELGLPAGTLVGQLGIESGFDVNARSGAGAVGLAQIMPSTVASLSKRAGRQLDPSKPEDAILMQKMLWQENLAATHGNVREAAARYHGGTDQANWGDKTNAYADAVSTPLPPGSAAAGGASGSGQQLDISHTITVQNQDGKPLAAPLKTRVSVPRGSGS